METEWKRTYPQDYTWLERHKKTNSVGRITKIKNDGGGQLNYGIL